jgi:hypothetical protein
VSPEFVRRHAEQFRGMSHGNKFADREVFDELLLPARDVVHDEVMGIRTEKSVFALTTFQKFHFGNNHSTDNYAGKNYPAGGFSVFATLTMCHFFSLIQDIETMIITMAPIRFHKCFLDGS